MHGNKFPAATQLHQDSPCHTQEDRNGSPMHIIEEVATCFNQPEIATKEA